MNRTQFRALVFNFCCTLFVVLGVSFLEAQQQEQDSLTYFSGLALQPKAPKDLESAYRYFIKQSEIELAKKDTLRAIYCYYYMASIAYKNGLYHDSEHSAVIALDMIDHIAVSPYVLDLKKGIYNHLGIVYKEHGSPEKAISLYDRSFELAKSAKDSAVLYNNQSNVYKISGRLGLAKERLEKAVTLLPRLNDTLSIALVYDNLGDVYSRLGYTAEALDFMERALDLRLQANAPSKVYTSYKHLTEHFMRHGDSANAQTFALKGYELAKTINSASYRLDALGGLVDLKAYDYIGAYKSLKDSLDIAAKQSFNRAMLIKYDYSEYKRKALESQLAQEREAYKTVIAFSVAGFLVLVGALGFIIVRAKHKKEKLQEIYNTETRISKQIHDEVANDVYHVMAKIQSTLVPNDTILDDLEGIYNRTRDISKENSTVDLDADFSLVISDLLLSYQTDKVTVITKNNSKIHWEALSATKKTTLYRVLQELMTNMRKHSQASLVVLSFEQQYNRIRVFYSDNGLGCDLVKQNGLQNAENRIKAINGTLTFDTKGDKGFKAQIVI